MWVAAVEPDGSVTHRTTRPTLEASSPRSSRRWREVLEGVDLSSAVVGVPGRVHYAEGRVEYAPNLRSRGWTT